MSPRTSSEAAPALKPVEFLRWTWTQLTSMRTALLLLFLLALAAIPGSMVPQTSISPIEVMDFKADNPTLDRFFEPLGMYNVYSSPWFSAIYILLFVSLVGCIVPRIGTYARALRTPPPKLPKRPERMPTSVTVAADGGSIARAGQWLRSKRYRVQVTDQGVSAERGYLREAGNLTFHTGLVFMLAGLAWSSLFGFQGSAVVVEGHSFTNVITQYDDFTHGGLYDRNSLEPFTLAVNDFHAEFETGDVQRGAARRFDAEVTVSGSDASGEHLLQVNHPLSLPHGTQVNLLGHGYAVQVTVTDGNGDVAFSGPVVMLPQDGNFSSVGVVKAPDARPDRLAFEGFFFPTAVLDETGPHSVFPDAFNPELYLNAWFGEPKVETGKPESVYVLDTEGLEPVVGDVEDDRLRMRLMPGDSYELPDGLGTLTFEGWDRWVKLQMSETPGNAMTLTSLSVAIAGLILSLYIKPRRLFVRVTDGIAAVAGLDRTDTATGLDDEVSQLADVVAVTESSPQTAQLASGTPGRNQ